MWGLLEDKMNVAIGCLLCNGVISGFIVSTHLDFSKKRDMLQTLAGIINQPTRRKELSEIIGEISTLNTFRNKVAHGFWIKGRKRGTIKTMRFEARGSIKLSGHLHNEPEYTVGALQKEVDKVKDVYRRLSDFVDPIVEQMPESFWQGLKRPFQKQNAPNNRARPPKHDKSS